jgi:hypothetical protein
MSSFSPGNKIKAETGGLRAFQTSDTINAIKSFQTSDISGSIKPLEVSSFSINNANIIKNRDINLDMNVDILDVAGAASLYGLKNTSLGWNSRQDINNDNIIDLYDMVLISRAVGTNINFSSLTVSAEQWETYSLAAPTPITFKDGAVTNFDITWNSGTLNTDIPGTYSLAGYVKEYNRNASLSVVVRSVAETGVVPNNITNFGITAPYGSWIYYNNPVNNGKLSKARKDGTGVKKLTEDEPLYINLYKGWVYYSNASDNFRIYKVKTDGSGRARLNVDNSHYTTVVSDYIYYINADDYYIYRIKLDGTGKVRVGSDKVLYINVSSGWIYYTNSEDFSIYKMRTDGTGRMKLTVSNGAVGGTDLNVQGDWIYFINPLQNRTIYKIKNDGTSLTKLNDVSTTFINVLGDWIYYIDFYDGKLHKIKIDGSGYTGLGSIEPFVINVAEDRLYVMDENDLLLYQMKNDGRELRYFGIDSVIQKIENVVDTATEGDYYEFPGHVIASMSDGSQIPVSVTWNNPAINTNVAGQYSYEGYAGGGSFKVNLTVTVLKKGNSNGNLHNKGFVAQRGGWIYYVNNHDDKLYKIKTDGTGRVKLCEDKARYINVIDNWIYYRNDSDDQKIYKIQTNGTGRMKISDDMVHELTAVGGYIYYTNILDNLKLYRLNLSNNSKNLISNHIVLDINIIGDTIYYLNRNDSLIYYVSEDGSHRGLLTDYVSASRMLISGKHIYIARDHYPYNIYRMNLYGEEFTQVTDEGALRYNVHNDWVYFSNKDDSAKLYKIRGDGQNKVKLTEDSLHVSDKNEGIINIFSDWIYYKNSSDANKLYRIKADGTLRDIFGYDTVIKSIDNISITVPQNRSYSLPSKIAATMSDGSYHDVAVVWDSNTIDTSKTGIYTFYGTVAGYSGKITLTLTVAAIEDRGNTVGNIANGAFVAQEGDWVYYNLPYFGDYFMKMRADGTGLTSMFVEKASGINISNGWFYYFLPDNGIYKIKTDGTGKTLVTIASTDRISVVGDWIYYNDASDGYRTYKIKTDGTGKVRLNTDQALDISVTNGWIYYRNGSDNYAYYKMKLDGSSKTKITSDFTSYANVVGDKIYYNDGNNLVVINTDGTGRKVLSSSSWGRINVTGDWIVYYESGGIYKMRTDGSSKVKLADESWVTSINVCGDWVYYGSYAYHRVKLDGSSNQILSSY